MILICSYVDSYRMMSVHMGTENDLKSVMQKKGMKVSFSLVRFLTKLIVALNDRVALKVLIILSIFYYFHEVECSNARRIKAWRTK